MEDSLEIISISEPDKDDMVNMEIEFRNEVLYKQLLEIAEKRGITLSELMVEAMIEYLEKLKISKG